MISAYIKSANDSNKVLTLGETLDVRVGLENDGDTPHNVQVNVMLRAVGEVSDPAFGNIDMVHLVQPGTVEIPVIQLEITREIGLRPGAYEFIMTVKDLDSNYGEQVNATSFFIDPRLFMQQKTRLAKNGHTIPSLIVWGDYAMICGGDYLADQGHGMGMPTIPQIYQALDDLMDIPHQLGIRCALMSGDPNMLHPWARTSDGKFDLERFDINYLQRIKAVADACAEREILLFVDLWEHCTLSSSELFRRHPLNPANNIQHSYGIPYDDTIFPYLYQTDRFREFAEFQKHYIKKISAMLKNNPYVIMTTGNEMFGGTIGERIAWQRETANWIREAAPCALISESAGLNDDLVHNLPETDILDLHGLGGIEITSETEYRGQPDYDGKSRFRKPLIFNTDGTWAHGFRDYMRGGVPVNMAEMWRLTQDGCNSYFAPKAPFSYESRWASFGVPVKNIFA